MNNEYLNLLTNQEKEIMSLLSRGHERSEVAAWLGIKPRTVSWHIQSVYAKLGPGVNLIKALLMIGYIKDSNECLNCEVLKSFGQFR